jgi:hypothetical protein
MQKVGVNLHFGSDVVDCLGREDGPNQHSSSGHVNILPITRSNFPGDQAML